MDHTGKVLAHPLPAWVQERKDISKIPPVARMLKQETGISTFYSPALKDDMIAGFTSVPGANWGVMIPQPFSELTAKAEKIQLHALIIVAMGFVAAALTSWIISGFLTRPLAAIAGAARNMGRGEKGGPRRAEGQGRSLRTQGPANFLQPHGGRLGRSEPRTGKGA